MGDQVRERAKIIDRCIFLAVDIVDGDSSKPLPEGEFTREYLEGVFEFSLTEEEKDNLMEVIPLLLQYKDHFEVIDKGFYHGSEVSTTFLHEIVEKVVSCDKDAFVFNYMDDPLRSEYLICVFHNPLYSLLAQLCLKN